MKTAFNKNGIIEIILEAHDGSLWGRVETEGSFMPTPYGETKEQVIENLKELIKDYVAHEGKKDFFWSRLDLGELHIEFKYDLQAYFQEHDYLKISSVATQAGLNPALLRQYASGVKYPSLEQTNKIRNAIKKIAKELSEDSIYVA